jgi:RHS repeat-associated protein
MKLRYAAGNTNKVYVGAVEYDNTNIALAPNRIQTEEGHILLRENWTESSLLTKYVYYYTLSDHLGNARLVMNDDQDAEVVQSNSYSAFGLLALGPDGGAIKFNNRFYNGKEKQEGTGWLDYGARMYSPEMGRWMSIDPLTEKNNGISGFAYANNNPILFTDPFGLDTVRATNNNTPVHKNDVVVFENGRTATASMNEVTVTAQRNSGQQESTTNGFMYGVGDGLNSLGDNSISTRGKWGGSTPGTSMASQYFRQTSWGQAKTPRWLFNSLPKRVGVAGYSMPFRSNNLGAVAGRSIPLLGRGFIGVSAGMSIYNVANSENKAQAITREGGGWAGAYAGAEGGAYIGGGIGAWFGGAGAAPGAVIGGIIGGGVGYFAGAEAGEAVYNKTQE